MSALATAPSDVVFLPLGAKAYDFAYRPPEDDPWLNILEGSVRSAKTWACIPKIINLCKYQVKGWKVFTGVTKETIYRNVLNDLFNIVGKDNYGFNRQNGELDLFGSKWLVMGAKDEGSEKILRGLTIGVEVGDELTLQTQNFRKTLLNRMSVEGARSYGTTNPDTPFHYLKTDYIDNKELKRQGKLFVEHFELDDNPNLPEDYKRNLSLIYPPGSLYHQRFVLGLWVTGEGAIYQSVWGDHLLYQDTPWEQADGKPGAVTPRHLRDAGSIVERTIVIDCGVDHVQVYLDVIDDGTTLFVDREYWWDSRITMRQKTDRQYREDLQEFLKKASGAKTILPPECASFDAELTQAGIWHVDADNEVLDGIKMTATMMALGRLRFRRPPDDYVYNGAEPIHNHAGETIKQMATYQWNPKASVRGIEEPLKVKDDGPDAVRYKVKTDIPAWRIAA